MAEPVSIRVEDFNTSSLSREKLTEMAFHFWNLTPDGIIKELDLLKPRYRPTSVYGHFGRNEPLFTWEKVNKTKDLQEWLHSAVS